MGIVEFVRDLKFSPGFLYFAALGCFWIGIAAGLLSVFTVSLFFFIIAGGSYFLAVRIKQLNQENKTEGNQ